MTPRDLLVLFIILKCVQFAIEKTLSFLNRRYYLQPENQRKARALLGISDADWTKTMEYTTAKYHFGAFSSRISFVIMMAFLYFGGLGKVEHYAQTFNQSAIVTGLIFFGVIALLSMLLSLPFELFSTFGIEQRFGFNRQTPKTFVVDKIKALILMAVLGGGVLSAILWIMQSMGNTWWIYAWLALTVFSFLTAWIYPTFLAPLFNKFKPLEEGELKNQIESLAQKIGFKASGISIMDASKRSSHGNAYFTGVFGAKKIVLFDTLVSDLQPSEIVAVLAHELGHFKLNHVRWTLIRSTIISALTFYFLSLCLPQTNFYEAFALTGVSNYGALIVFTLWFGLLDFYLEPFMSYISRRNEFAADNFAKENLGTSNDLSTALLKMREKSFVMPISHPLYSAVYHSHPPLITRLDAMKS